mmetsp:Transcript_38760/g.37107  ORF Transcript_38760/g.37107 Transcript_38760/m.37107 type:complete len:105 (-) Transcript_38760:19-333(-)
MDSGQEEEIDYGFQRDPELWEFTDGSIFLMRELSKLGSEEKVAALIMKMMPKLSMIGNIDFFTYSSLLKENLFKTIMEVARNVGKKKFRGQVELFLDCAFMNAK